MKARIRRFGRGASLLTSALWLAGVAPATAPAGQPSGATAEPPIVVTGHRQAEVKRLVDALAPSVDGHQLARWTDGICVGVFGLEPAYADAVRGRVEALAAELGLTVDKRQSCTPNLAIAFTPDPTALAHQFIGVNWRILVDPDRDRAQHERERELLADRPVRWTSVSEDRRPGGLRHDNIGELTRTHEVRMRSTVFTLVIVDEGRVRGASWRQLADYVSVVALSRPAEDATYGSDTILSLFNHADGAAPPATMTEEDRRFLLALYSAEPAASAKREQDEIAARIGEAARGGDRHTPIAPPLAGGAAPASAVTNTGKAPPPS